MLDCQYKCLYTHIYVCVCICRHRFTCGFTGMHLCSHVYTCIFLYLYLCVFMHTSQALTCACTHLYMSTPAFYTTPLYMCLQVYVCFHTDMFTHISVFVCVFACVHTCMHVLTDSWPLPHSLCHTLPLGNVFYKAICHPSWPRSTEVVTVTGDLGSLQCLSGSDSSLRTS